MSEDFDREAEKKRLREKLETEDGRQTTEHMSELLLKGATMTNRHCEECGDPIFRYDGQEFCPTCQEEVQDSGGDQDAKNRAGAASEQTPADPAGQPSADAGAQSQSASAPESESESEQRSPASTQRAAGGRGAGSQTAPGARGGDPGGAEVPTGEIQADATGDLAQARASLGRTLTTLAARAEEATDVRRTRDLLAAAREAAEAIAALDRTGR